MACWHPDHLSLVHNLLHENEISLTLSSLDPTGNCHGSQAFAVIRTSFPLQLLGGTRDLLLIPPQKGEGVRHHSGETRSS